MSSQEKVEALTKSLIDKLELTIKDEFNNILKNNSDLSPAEVSKIVYSSICYIFGTYDFLCHVLKIEVGIRKSIYNTYCKLGSEGIMKAFKEQASSLTILKNKPS